MLDEVKIHGTYPFDEERRPWRTVRLLEVEEAAALTRAPMKEVRPGASDIYLWLNKGYIVLNTTKDGLNQTTAGIVEASLGKCSVPWPIGTQAVYLADGRYMLIERCER